MEGASEERLWSGTSSLLGLSQPVTWWPQKTALFRQYPVQVQAVSEREGSAWATHGPLSALPQQSARTIQQEPVWGVFQVNVGTGEREGFPGLAPEPAVVLRCPGCAPPPVLQSSLCTSGLHPYLAPSPWSGPHPTLLQSGRFAKRLLAPALSPSEVRTVLGR